MSAVYAWRQKKNVHALFCPVTPGATVSFRLPSAVWFVSADEAGPVGGVGVAVTLPGVGSEAFSGGGRAPGRAARGAGAADFFAGTARSEGPRKASWFTWRGTAAVAGAAGFFAGTASSETAAAGAGVLTGWAAGASCSEFSRAFADGRASPEHCFLEGLGLGVAPGGRSAGRLAAAVGFFSSLVGVGGQLLHALAVKVLPSEREFPSLPSCAENMKNDQSCEMNGAIDASIIYTSSKSLFSTFAWPGFRAGGVVSKGGTVFTAGLEPTPLPFAGACSTLAHVAGLWARGATLQAAPPSEEGGEALTGARVGLTLVSSGSGLQVARAFAGEGT